MFRRRVVEVRVVKRKPFSGTEEEINTTKEPVVGPDYTEAFITLGLVVGGLIVLKGATDTIHDVAVEIAKK
jgi:hypothetical protein